jgi:hypothetical protein
MKRESKDFPAHCLLRSGTSTGKYTGILVIRDFPPRKLLGRVRFNLKDYIVNRILTADEGEKRVRISFAPQSLHEYLLLESSCYGALD